MERRGSTIRRFAGWCAAVLGAVVGGSASAQFAHWERGPQFPYPSIANRGTNGSVFATAVWDPDGSGYQREKLVVGGLFTRAGSVTTVSNIAYWDGANWFPLGQGFNGAVNDIEVFNGELYAAGSFTLSGATTCNRVARYNATTHAWVAVGSGFNGEVLELEVHENQLFAGGRFSASGATTTAKIARLVSGAWAALSGGGTGGDVYALHSLGGKLYVGGVFTNAGSVTVRNLARWSATSIWEDVLQGANGGVVSLGDSGGRLVVGGVFSTVHGTTIASPGVGLYVPGSPGIWISGIAYPGSQVNAVLGDAIGPTEIYAASLGTNGGNVVYRYDGTSWTVAAYAPSTSNYAWSLIRYENEVHVGGSFTLLNGGLSSNNIARLHDGNFEPLTPRLNGPVAEFINYGPLVIGGSFEQTLPDYSGFSGLFSWSKSGYSSYGMVAGDVSALFVRGNGVSLSSLYVGGLFQAAGTTGITANNVASWSPPIGTGGPGANWAALGSGFTNATPGFNAPVFAMTGFGTTGGPLGTPIPYAGGFFTHSGGTACSGVARYVSGAWQPLGTGVTSTNSFNWVNCFTNYGGQLIVGGVFDFAGGLTANSIGAWNGTTWSTLGTGMRSSASKGTVSAMISFGGNLVAGGRFDTAGGATVKNIARWNGTAWSDMSVGIANVDEEISALANYGNELYCATTRIPPGLPTEGRVYRWTGSQWEQVGGTTDDFIYALYPYKNRLQVGGAFRHASGIDSRYWSVINKYCPADLDDGLNFGTSDGGVDISDLLFFLSKFESGNIDADLDNGGGVGNPDGGVDINDLLYFLAHFEAGC